jgi:hypothetical protein
MRSRPTPFFAAALAGLLLCVFTVAQAWAEPVNVFRMYKLPKGLNWGQADGDVKGVLDRERATITNKDGDASAEIWEVKGLFVKDLDSASFTFIDKKLEAVELRYGNPKWNEKKARGAYTNFQIAAEHAIGSPSDTHREKSGQGGIEEITEATEWRTGDDIVHLVFFSAVKGKETFHLVSVHLTRKQGEAAMKAIAEANVPADLKDPPGAGGPGETLFLVEPDLPQGAGGVAMPEEPLPADLFSEQNLQAGGETKVTPEVDALAIAAEAAASTATEAAAGKAAPTAVTPVAAAPETVQEQPGAAAEAVEQLQEMATEAAKTEPAPTEPKNEESANPAPTP